ncbi:amino acid ABC transporter substrate-binding protein [uncultured Clostridium sp.]|uniref:amino acid ABC transporter substrate-binding protein n=1 Tax=uncultured Clostridium sp. TaxID=59620 RepID=UPI0025D3EB8C|nr:amino acid ABC transporter substrate-binding protein [uncultured Clostridium sp.]
MKLKKIIKSLTLTVIIGVLAISVVGCNKEQGSTLDKETLILGFDDTFVPMGFKDNSGEYTGFDIEVAKEVAKKLDKKIEFQPIDWTMKESELNNGNIDLIWNGYSITDERKEKVLFSNAYLKNRQVIVVLADSNINSKEDLNGKIVAAQDQSSAVDAIGDYKDKFKELVTFSTNDEALRDLESGRSDAVVADEILAKYYMNLKGKEKYKVLDDDFGKEEYAVGVRKGDSEFISKFNEALKEVINEGKAKEISEKWFGEDIVEK